jgi:hypothetical protein
MCSFSYPESLTAHLSCIITYVVQIKAFLEFEDTKGIIRVRKSKKDRQHHGQKKKDKSTNNDLQDIHIKLKTE